MSKPVTTTLVDTNIETHVGHVVELLYLFKYYKRDRILLKIAFNSYRWTKIEKNYP